MSRRDRDRSFEQALARHFSNASLHHAPGPLCPDAETLAAYHENALAPQELLSWKQHFTSCARCRELLKHLGASDNIVLEALEVEKPAALARPSYPMIKTRRSWLPLEWVSYWRWMVPAGALAAGLLVWVAIRPRQTSYDDMAKNQTASLTEAVPETARSVSPPKTPASAEAPRAAPSRDADHAPAGSPQIAAGDTSRMSDLVAPEKRASVAPQANLQSMAPAPAAADRRDQNAAGAHQAKERERPEVSFYRQGLDRPPAKPRAVQSRSETAADLKKEAAGLTVETPALPDAVAQTRITPPEKTSVEPMQSKTLPFFPGTQEEAEKLQSTARSPNGGLGIRTVSAQSSATILAPDGRVLWRVGIAGRIEHSGDGGKNWVAQRSPVAVDLLAGSAVSDQVCWIIGRAGTILRTTDGGAHWVKLPSPSTQDLSAVRATDAQQAVIFDATKQRSYRTTDGGARWTELPAE